MTTVIHKTPDFTRVPLYTLKRGDCFKLLDHKDDNHLYMQIGVPDIRWAARVYISGKDLQCAIDLDTSNKELHWFNPERMVKPIDVWR